MRLSAFVCFILLFVARVTAAAQGGPTGKIAGRVTDAHSGAPLANTMVQITGTTIGTMTSDDGRFEIRGVPAGTQSLTIRRMGYSPRKVPGIVVEAGGTAQQQVTMETAVTELQAQRITAAADRGTVAVAVQQQREAPAVVNAITAEQITKSPDGDAAQAVQRVSGVTVRDGKYVFVRGLGERYTTTSLNGARIPSPEPEKRVVPLDMFPSSLLQGIVTSKTFTPDQPGDFGGASVDIQMREFPLSRVFTYSNSVGMNPAVSGKTMRAAPGEGMDWLAVAGDARSLSNLVGIAARSDTASRTTINRAIRSLRNVWATEPRRMQPNYSASASLGGSVAPFRRRIGFLGSVTYSGSQEIRENQVQALAVNGGDGKPLAQDQYAGHSVSSGVLWGGIFNASTLLGDKTRVQLNNTYNRGSDNESRDQVGIRNTDNEYPSQRSSVRFIERSVRSNQLRVEHMFTDRKALALTLTSSSVSRNEPDRTDVEYIREEDPATGERLPYRAYVNSQEGLRKMFGTLGENNINSTADYTHGPLKFGGALRYTTRDVNNKVYSVMNTSVVPRDVLERPAGEFLSGEYTQDAANYFRIQENSVGGRYSAEDMVGAGYAMLDHWLGDSWRLIGGVRVESSRMTVRSVRPSGEKNTAELNNVDVLPALNVQYRINDNHQLRFGASQTVSRPDYREISPNDFPEWDSRQISFGNVDLKRSLIQNLDLRWEWYPSRDELISIGLFSKRHSAPIERVEVATSGATQVSFANASSGYNYGLEIEVRKQLGVIADALSPFTVFTNTTLMKSEVDLTSNSTTVATNKKRAMVGQAPYVVNFGLNYATESGRVSSTLLYNVIGKRIHSAGVSPLPDIVERPRNALDFSLQIPLLTKVNAKFDAKNLLNDPYERVQGNVIRERYESGRVFSLGLRWQP